MNQKRAPCLRFNQHIVEISDVLNEKNHKFGMFKLTNLRC